MTNDTKRPFQILRDKFEKQSRAVGEKILKEQKKGPRSVLATTHIGNEHISIPGFLIADPILEPVDKAVYNAIRLVTPRQMAGEPASYPTYKDISQMANIASDATVSRALIILRLMRWMSQRTLSASTGVMGNVYMTHDHPLDFDIIQELDKGYSEFVLASLNHHHARVRAVAEVILESFENHLVKTEATHHVMEDFSISSDHIQGDENSDYFSISADAIKRLKQTSKFKEPNLAGSLNIKEPIISGSSNIKEDPTSNIKEPVKTPTLNIEEGELLGSSNIKALSSSSRILKTTTTKAGNLHFAEPPDEKLLNEIEEVFPMLSKPQHTQMGRIVMRWDVEEDRYSAIYEVANRMRYGKTEMYNPVGYLGSIIGKFKAGEFPLSSYADKNYGKSQSKPAEQKTKTVGQEINEIRNELSSIANEIAALENMQKQTPNPFFEKQLAEFKQQAKKLTDKRNELEESGQSQRYQN